MKRILVIGISGTGKTRFAYKLSKKLNISIIHLDSIFWNDNWQEEKPSVVKETISDIIHQNLWIIEGYIEPLGRERVDRADVIYYLDYSGLTALYGGLQRWMRYRNKSRPEMPKTNIESFGFKFLLSLLKRDERPEIERVISNTKTRVVRFKSRHEAERFLSS